MRLSNTLLLISVFSLSAWAGPACARRHRHSAAQDCLAQCKGKWGWPGWTMGTDPWGPVLKPVSSERDRLAVAGSACGNPVAKLGSDSTQEIASIAIRTNPLVTVPASALPSTPTGSGGGGSVVAAAVDASSTGPGRTEPSPQPTQAPPPPPPPGTTPPTAIQEETTSEAPIPSEIARFTPATTATPQTTFAPLNPPPGRQAASPGSDVGAYLSAHNDFRAQHGAAPLQWSDQLAAKAQEWANNCRFEHSGGSLGPFGENLAAGTGDEYDAFAAVQDWTDEVSEYDPSNPSASHFTQVVWKSSTQLGCAVALCDGIFDVSFGKAKFHVCEYSPAGNVVGQFADNVEP